MTVRSVDDDDEMAGGFFDDTPTESLPTTDIGPSTAQRRATAERTGDRRRSQFDRSGRYARHREAEFRASIHAQRFSLVRRLGAGGTGLVYEAYDRQRGERVALKTMRRADSTALIRFQGVFRSFCNVGHPNLVNLYDLIAAEDCWFLTMELLEGCDFARYVRARAERAAAAPAGVDTAPESGVKRVSRRRGNPTDRAARIGFDEPRLREALRQLATGVGAFHRTGKLHRDIKPGNVMVTPDGRTVLLDFGLAIDVGPNGTYCAKDWRIVGTPLYMSPEQAAGFPITAASDWYSVGVMLYAAMTGRLPFFGTFEDVAYAKLIEAAPAPGSLVSGLPDDLATLCVGLLDRDPSRRPTGRQIIEHLHLRTDSVRSR
jgi:eukaryotic-like serine/threonine-protein kinase